MSKRFTLVVVGTLLGLTALVAGAQPVAAQAPDAQKRSLEGVWRVAAAPYFCATGLPVPGAAFEVLLTFHKGGTMSGWLQNSVISITRSPSHGLWQREKGWSEYSTRFIHLRYDLATGAFLGTQEALTHLVLGTSGNEFTAESTNSVFDKYGNLSGGGCAKMVGARFE
jgi:hypothetical protein